MHKQLRRVGSILAAVGLSAGLTALSVEPASATAKSTATKSEYGRIKTGQTLAQVRKTIGAAGTRAYSKQLKAGEQVYVWRSTKGKNVYVDVLNGKVAGKARVEDQTVSGGEYHQLKKGTRYSKVAKIIRNKGHKAYSERKGGKLYTGYVWINDSNTKTVSVLFANGKLVGKWLTPYEG